MKTFHVVINKSAVADLDNLLDFLKAIMSYKGALRYIETMISEVQSLSIFAGLYQPSRSITLRRIHPQARRMLSHNRRWNYVFHIVGDFVVVDRIIPSKMIVI